MSEMINTFYKDSELRLVAEYRDGKTILSEKFFTPPFKIMHPIYQNGDIMQVLLLMASPGIMEGDVQKFDFTVKEGAKAEFMTQAYEKVHAMHDGYGDRETKIAIEKNGFFYYHPKPIQPFADSAVVNKVDIDLEDDTAQLVYEEILSGGRKALGESFDYRFYNNIVSVRKAGKLIYKDNTQFRPDEFDMTGLGMFEGYSHLATQIFFNIPKSDEWMAEVTKMINSRDDMEGGVTRLSSGDVCVRFFGQQGDPMEKLLEEIQAL